MTNEEIVQSKWQKVVGRVKYHWPKLTLEDLEIVRESNDELVPLLQKRYGYRRDYATKEIRLWFDRQCTIAHPKAQGESMLVTFTSKVHPDIVMFGEIAQSLLTAMGQHEDVPGILRGANIRLAADKLRSHLQKLQEDHDTRLRDGNINPDGENLEETEEAISLRRRALPLLEMLETSYQENTDVIWR